MWQMYLAAGKMTCPVARGRETTMVYEIMRFLRLANVGDEVTHYATLKDFGQTAICILDYVWARPRLRRETREVTDAEICFVALDDDGRPRQIEIAKVRDLRRSGKEGIRYVLTKVRIVLVFAFRCAAVQT